MKNALFLSALIGLFTAIAVQAARPNIVLIMVDDLGYSDFGCYGSEIKTPHIDSLAQKGMKFRQFYNTAKCHSSRVSLLTGLYCNQAGSEKLSRGVTIAELLANAGYSTAMVGKWHLDRQPTDRGFHKYFGHLSGATNFFTGDDTFRLNGNPWSEFGDDFYTTIANIEYGKQFVGEMLQRKGDHPFFLYVAHNAPHYPLHALEEDFNKYKDTYKVGWDAIRAARYQRQLKSGLIPDTWELPPRPAHVPAWTALSDEDKDWEARRMAAFAGMVDRVDQVTGDLITFLKEKGEFDNTLIMICSDNGACPFDRTRGKEFVPWDPRSYWCYDTGWSHVGNTPFRLHKQNQHEGGISSPMIAHWPAGITAPKGSTSDEPSHLIDFMATCIDVGKARYPKHWPGIDDLQPLQGKSLLPIFQGKEREGHEELYFQFGTNRALRMGDWKLVTHRASSWELYNMVKDRTEMNNHAKVRPERLARMVARWHELAETKDMLSDKSIAPVSGKAIPSLAKSGGVFKADAGAKKTDKKK